MMQCSGTHNCTRILLALDFNWHLDKCKNKYNNQGRVRKSLVFKNIGLSLSIKFWDITTEHVAIS